MNQFTTCLGKAAIERKLKVWRKISQITHLKYSVRDGCVTITLARGKEQRRQKSDAFDRIFSHHVYAVAKKGFLLIRLQIFLQSISDYDFTERKLDKPVPNRLAIRDIPEKDKTVKAEIKTTTTHVDPFKKKVISRDYEIVNVK